MLHFLLWFILKDTNEHLDKEGNRWSLKGSEIQHMDMSANLEAPQNPPLKGFYRGSIIWAWLIKSLATGD